jgi:hypothetical protein
MTAPHYINENQSDIRAIKPGWYGVESNGNLSSGPYPNQWKCLAGITQGRANFRASPAWLRTIKCTACGDEHLRPCTRVDETSREWIVCETCGHTFSLEEISSHIFNSIASSRLQAVEDTR